MAEKQKFATSTLSKKRYEDIKQVLEEMLGDRAEEALAKIQEIMKFDPSLSKYTPEEGKRAMEARKRRADARGVTTYVTGGGKAFYEKKKRERESAACV